MPRFSRCDWLIVAVLMVATVAIYARTGAFDFVQYDDPEYVFENHHVLSGLSAANVLWAFTTFEHSNWHPLTWLSYMLDVQLFGARAGAMHLVNVAFHALNALLLFLLLREMTASSWRSALVAALFALHPLHVESVAWISERKDVLSTFFGFGALLAYVNYARRGSDAAYAAMILLFVLSLLSKPMLVTLPFVLLLLDYWPLERMGRVRWLRLIVEKAPLLVLSAGSCVVTYFAQMKGGAMSTQYTFLLRMLVRLANAATSYVQYIIDMFWPVRLAVLYPFPRQQSIETAAAALLALVLFTVVVLCWARRRKHLPVGWFWYLGTLVPVIGIVAVGEQARADRYTYVPLIGLFIMIAWSVPAPRGNAAKALSGVAATVVLLALSIQTWRQIAVWRDSETLFTHALNVVGPHPSLYLNYGVAVELRGDHDKAAELYQSALKLRPRYPQALNNVGLLLARQGKLEESLGCFRRAIEMNPSDPLTFYNLGTTLMEHGRLAEAEEALREALRLRPDHPAARTNLELIVSARKKPR